jgi:hypothetical protein
VIGGDLWGINGTFQTPSYVRLKPAIVKPVVKNKDASNAPNVPFFIFFRNGVLAKTGTGI